MSLGVRLVFKVTTLSLILLAVSVVFAPFAHASHTGAVYSKLPFLQTGSGHSAVYNIRLDSSNNVYLVGIFSGTIDFNPGSGVDNRTSAGGYDAYLTKINADGSYGYTKVFAGDAEDYAVDLALDSSNNVYVVGFSQSTSVNFDPAGGGDVKSPNNIDGFITKINANGSYGYTRLLGGSGADAILSIAIDSSDNVYLAGGFSGTVDMDILGTVANRTSNGGSDGFVMRMSTAGNFVYALTVGGTSDDSVSEVKVDSSGNVIYGGYFKDAVDINPTAGSDVQTAAIGGGFIVKVSSSTTPSYVFGKALISDTINAETTDMAVDSSGNIYAVGNFSGTVDFNPGVSGGDMTVNGGNFIVKYGPTGTFQFVHQTKTGHPDEHRGLVTDAAGGVIVTNFFDSAYDFNQDGSGDTITPVGPQDIYITRFNADGSYDATTTIGTADAYGSSFAAALSSSGMLYVGGIIGTAPFDFDPSLATAVMTPSSGFVSGFVAAYNMTTLYGIQNLPAGFSLVNAATGDSLLSSPHSGAAGTVTAQLLKNGKPLALADVTMTADHSWSAINGDTDFANSKSVVSGLAAAPGVAATHSLYIPKAVGDQAVIICPSAVSLSEVTLTCPNRQILTAASAGVSVVTIGGQSYWLVGGLTGTGGMSYVSGELARTGVNSTPYILLGIALTATGSAWLSLSFRRKQPVAL